MIKCVVTPIDENQRVDKYVMKILDKSTKGFIYKMFRKKNIKLNNNRIEGNEILKAGDEISIYFSDDTFSQFSSSKNVISSSLPELDIIYEDENVLVVNKPQGILSQPDGKNESILDKIEQYLMNQSGKQGQFSAFRPGICNRLDRNTSGIILAGKNVTALQCLNQAIKSKNVEKTYLTIVCGKIQSDRVIEGYLNKDGMTNRVTITNNPSDDYIKTYYKPIQFNDEYTLLEVQIETGKSHQIRAHLKSIGHPVIGDYKYGNRNVNDYLKKKFGLSYQLLHAYQYRILEIDQPLTYLNGMSFNAQKPRIFEEILKELIPS